MSHRLRILNLLCVVAIFTVAATAQITPRMTHALDAMEDEILGVARMDPDDLDEDQLDELIDDYLDQYYLLPDEPDAIDALRQELYETRTDLQAGASSSASGSTSAIASPLLPAIFGFAFENGAMTRTVAGNVLTMKVNPAGLLCSATSNARAVQRRNSGCAARWQRLGVTASFDTSRGEKSSQIENLDSLNNQFSELNVRYALFNQRVISDDNRDSYQEALDAFYSNAAGLVSQTNISIPTERLLAFRLALSNALVAEAQSDEYASADPPSRAAMLRAVFAAQAFPAGTEPDPELRAEVEQQLRDTVLSYRSLLEVMNAPVLTAEYSLQKLDLVKAAEANEILPAGNRPPDLHTARLIFAKGIGDSALDLTANASVTWFGDTRPGMSGSFRDFRVGGQATFRLREIQGYGVPTLSFAGLYTYLHQQPLGLGLTAFNQTEIAEKGHIGLFQTKLEFPTGNNTVRIPVSFTYSNRTELIQESEVRGQIGISFNLDSLFVQPN